MNSPWLSIVIPAHNGETFLPRILDCIRGQMVPDTEIIIVEDSSTDGTAALCDSLTEPFIRVLHVAFRDVSLTRNAGLEAAKGDYIFFIDCDDLLEPSALPELCQIVKDSHPDIVRFGFRKILSTHEELWCSPEPEGLYTGEKLRPVKLDAIYFENALDYSRPRMLSVWDHLYSREFLMKNNLRLTAERKVLNEDYLFVMQTMWKAESVYICRKPYYQYLLREESLSTAARPNMYQRKQNLYKIYCDFLPKDDTEVRARLLNFYIDCIYNCFVEVCLTTRKLKDAKPRIKPLLEDSFLHEAIRLAKPRIRSLKAKIICFFMDHRMGSIMFSLYQLQADRHIKRKR